MLFFPRATPNLATVILTMDHIDQLLTTTSLNCSYTLAIHAAVGTAKKTLSQYYALTDHSEVYHIAMGKYSLHSTTRYKANFIHPQYSILITKYHTSRLQSGKKTG